MVATQPKNGMQAEASAVPTNPGVTELSKSRQRQPQENNTEKAIKEIKNLVSLKLKVQQSRKQVVGVREAIGRLFSDDELAEAEAQQLLEQIDALGDYIKLRQQYRQAREKARPALALLEESEISEDEILEFN
ncbi:MAG: hypothetical protein KME03_07385 [Aphanocapsa lilacina HA4352-LM1]|jgi:two-component SAPR family response regulator|nr:hypothetical protein [Aphanocapsa lilacina HA4352-LM1]